MEISEQMKFNWIHIQNFKAVKDVKLEYKAGLWSIYGENRDGPFSSNGSSKTTILEAVQQCLFNRTTLNIPIEDTSRRLIGSGTTVEYKLTTEFEKSGHVYTVINDRELMKITILEDGKDLGLTSIPRALRRIQDIIGMDLTTFITLTFITHTTISDLLDNFSSSSLMKIILDFNQISAIDKGVKARIKDLDSQISSKVSSIKTINNSLDLLSTYTKIDTSGMHKNKASLVSKLVDVNAKLTKYKEYRTQLRRLQEEQTSTEAKLLDMKSGLCKCCGAAINVSQLAISDLELQLSEIERSLAELPYDIFKTITLLEDTKIELSDEINRITLDITAADTKNQIYEDNLDKTANLRKDLVQAEAVLGRLKDDYYILSHTSSIIKSGNLHKQLLQTFVVVLNSYLNQFKTFVNLPYISVQATTSKSSVDFVIYDVRFNKNIHVNSLSGGEKTRMRLILLLGMLYTIKDLTNASTNLLIFDESLDTLDSSASDDLAKLFDYLITNDQKFIALVSHGQQLDKIAFTGSIKVIKEGGIATIEEVIYE